METYCFAGIRMIEKVFLSIERNIFYDRMQIFVIERIEVFRMLQDVFL